MPTAFVLMRCEDGAEKRIMRNLVRSEAISEVAPTIGHYDLIAKISSPAPDDVEDMIRRINRDDQVRAAKVLRMNE